MPSYVTRVLHYGGVEYELPDDTDDPLAQWDGGTGTITVDLGAGRQVTIAVGPGIPVAYEVRPRP
jgi:hypothetical protein